MTGRFAKWQPRYAERGIPTFPVYFDGADKKPRTNGYLKIGTVGSHQLALRFTTDDAFGFALGRRTRITVLDIDTTCERARDEAFTQHGEPAIVVRTLRGHWQGWYRHNGEPRRIRPWPGQPIDLLGAGYVVAPPSQGPQGRYAFVQGRFEDLDRLSPLRNVDMPPLVVTVREGERNATLVREGERHKALLRHCLLQAPRCDDRETLLDCARTFAEGNLDMIGTTHPVTDAEIVRVASWAWNIEAADLNLVGRGGALMVRHEEVDNLNPDATFLLLKLRRYHWDRRVFALANAMAPSFGWGLNRLKGARDGLVRAGIIECVRPGGRGKGDPPIYRWRRK